MSTCGFSTLSLPSRGAFHLSLTVLVHYRSSRVFSLGAWSPPLPTGFLVSRGTDGPLPRAMPVSSTGLSPSLARRSSTVRLPAWFLTRGESLIHSPEAAVQPRTDIGNQTTESVRFRLLPVRSPLLGESVSLPHPTEMFQFGWCPSHAYRFSVGCHPLPDGGLPHSEIPGSMLVSSSPRLVAASHVLHRHATPRHPPHACIPSSSLPPSLQAPSSSLTACTRCFFAPPHHSVG